MSASSARVAAVHRGGLELITESGTQAGFVTGRLRHEARSPVDLPAVGDHVTYDPESGAVHVGARAHERARARGAQRPRGAGPRRQRRPRGRRRVAEPRAQPRPHRAHAHAGRRRARRRAGRPLEGRPRRRPGRARGRGAGRARPAPRPVLPVSTVDGTGIDAVAALLGPGVTGVLLGASGVGKTTLLNALSGGDAGDRPDPRGRRPRPPHDHARASSSRSRAAAW